VPELALRGTYKLYIDSGGTFRDKLTVNLKVNWKDFSAMPEIFNIYQYIYAFYDRHAYVHTDYEKFTVVRIRKKSRTVVTT